MCTVLQILTLLQSKRFLHPRQLCLAMSFYSHPPLTQPLANSNLFCITIFLSFRKCHANEIIKKYLYRPACFTQHNALEIHPNFFCVSIFQSFFGRVEFYYMAVSPFVFQLKGFALSPVWGDYE